jgi:uncharacterized protein YabN with tetrapyrrole methylase and pyrophosphatase domain
MVVDRSGSLVVVGTGYHIAGQTTSEALDCLRESDAVFYLVYDALTESWVRSLNPTAVSLLKYVKPGRPSIDCCNAMVNRILSAVGRGLDVCAAFSGHPCICLYPSHEAVRRVRSQGFRARILPGVSALDCMFADLGVDPIRNGYRVLDATAFLIYGYKPQPSSALILLQIGNIGRTAEGQSADVQAKTKVLREVLEKSYPACHPVILYETAPNPLVEPRMQRVSLSKLDKQEIRFTTTLYIPATVSGPESAAQVK